METHFSLGVYAVKFHCKLCSSQSCNALSTQGNETFHSHWGLDPDNECKKILQPCIRKRNILSCEIKSTDKFV